jgi:hypothetical protein
VAILVRKDDTGELADVTDDDIAQVMAMFVPSKAMN